LLGTNWYILYLLDNMDIEYTGYVSRYNCNSMIWAAPIGADPDTWTPWYTGDVVSGDYNLYVDWSGDYTETEAGWWKFFVIQLIRDASSLRSRMWLKVGTRDIVKIRDDEITHAAMRSGLVDWGGWTTEQAAAWTPGAINRVCYGDMVDSPSYVTHCTIDDSSSEPSLATLEAMAAEPASAVGAYAAHKLTWESGAAVLTDRSGNARHAAAVANLYEGVDFEDDASDLAFPPLFPRRQNTLLRR